MKMLPEFLKNYPGNKDMQGLTEKIINQIPPHKLYVERFAGSASVYRRKKPALVSALFDVDLSVIEALEDIIYSGTSLMLRDILSVNWNVEFNDNSFVFDDPPYPIEARLSKSKIYVNEMSIEDHERYLMAVAIPAKYNLMICSNPNFLYETLLKDWRKIEIEVSYHGQPAKEILYMNYPEPIELHEYTYLGNDCWERQRISRKIKRQVSKLKKLPALERNAIIEQIKNNF